MCFCLWYKTYNAIEGAESWDDYDVGYDDFDDNYNSDSDPPTTRLTLSIVRLDEIQINNNGSSERDDPSMMIANLVNETFAELSCISPEEARAYHHNHLRHRNCYHDDDKTTTQQQQQSHCDTMKKSILQYHINTDKWVGFTSTLLKSLAYHRSIIDHRYYKLVRRDDHNDIVQQSQQRSYPALPIVDLPRTKYNRPYLPRVTTYNSSMSNNASSSSSSSLYHDNNNNNSSRGGVDENWYSCMNITHQYPFICMVQQQQRQHQQQQRRRRRKNQSMVNNDKTLSQLVVGVDVVTFHINLNTYTPTVRDFLNSLLHCFTTWEWNRIINTTTKKQQRNSATTTTTNNDNSHRQQQQQQLRSDTSSIYEFYLRWAMKEAYTKALGLGMEINFNEVEVRLFGIDINVDAAAAVSYCATTTTTNTADIEREDEEGIWTTIQRHVRTTCSSSNSSSSSSGNQRQFSVIGKVKRTQCDTSIQVMSSTLSTWEVWEFIFVPLYNSTTTDVVDDGTDDDEDSIDSVPDFLRYIDDNNDNNDDDDDASDNNEDVTTNNITNDCNGEDESLVDLPSLDTTGLTPTENTTTAAAAATTTMVGMEACACICRGPLPANTTSYGINPTATAANLEYLTLTELIQLHRMGGGGYNPRTQQAQTMNQESSTLFVNETKTDEMYDTTTTTTNTNNLSTMEQMSNMLGFGRRSVMNDALDQHDDDSRDKQSNLSPTRQAVGVVVDGILSNMSSMTNAVMERGSKLTTLAEKTQTLEAASLDFAIMAKELNQRQNSWW